MKERAVLAAEELDRLYDPRLDQACKEIFKYKELLAPILKACVAGFEKCENDYIAQHCIQEPKISEAPVMPGAEPKIYGLDTEDWAPGEGRIAYDIRFDAYYPGSDEMVKVLIDLEVQNDYYPGYDLVTRGLYYGARLLSAQNQRELRDRPAKEREEILEKEFGIRMTEELKGEMDKMSSISIAIAMSSYEEGMEQGIERGEEQGYQKAVRTALQNGGSVDLVAQLLGLDKSQVEELKQE